VDQNDTYRQRPVPGLDYLDITAPIQKPRHGGYRPGAGRPKGAKNRETVETEQRRDALQHYIIEHALLKEKITYFDKHGNLKTKKRERVLLILDMLFQEAMKGNLPAIKLYLDRALGKVGYMAGHYSSSRAAAAAYREEPEVERRPPSKAAIAAMEAYEKTLAEEEEN